LAKKTSGYAPGGVVNTDERLFVLDVLAVHRPVQNLAHRIRLE
jgi:hypothetical protein